MDSGAMAAAIVVVTVVEAASYVLFSRDIIRGRARPSRASWLIWAPLTWLMLASSWSAGADVTLFKLAATATGITVVAMLALAWGSGGRSRGELACLMLTVVGVTLWWRADDPALGLALFIGADICGALPTLCHAWHRPDEESLHGWSATTAASLVNLALVDAAQWRLTDDGFGVWGVVLYMALINVTVMALLLLPRRRLARPAGRLAGES